MKYYDIAAVIKWFKATKGYGFVNVNGVKDDIFMHSTCLRSVGIDPAIAQEGMQVLIDYEHLPESKKMQVFAIKAIDGIKISQAAPSSTKKPRFEKSSAAEKQLLKKLTVGRHISGVVKMYNSSKGFGFLALQDYADIFFHVSAIPDDLQDGVAVGKAYDIVVGASERGLCANILHETVVKTTAKPKKSSARKHSSADTGEVAQAAIA